MVEESEGRRTLLWIRHTDWVAGDLLDEGLHDSELSVHFIFKWVLTNKSYSGIWVQGKGEGDAVVRGIGIARRGVSGFGLSHMGCRVVSQSIILLVRSIIQRNRRSSLMCTMSG